MSVQVITSIEAARGCGYRKPSKSGVGIYLIGPAQGAPCGRLPLPLHVCPVCSSGIKASRGWTWIDPGVLFGHLPSPSTACTAGAHACVTCPIGLDPAALLGKHGLLWIGEQHYRSPHLFMAEARKRGISRKLGALPKDFKLGETWVFLAHRKTIPDPEHAGEFLPGVFSMFRPTGVDLVIADEKAVPERAIKLAEELGSAARIVKVVRDADTQRSLFEEQPDGAT